jgi:hypothetical protein
MPWASQVSIVGYTLIKILAREIIFRNSSKSISNKGLLKVN